MHEKGTMTRQPTPPDNYSSFLTSLMKAKDTVNAIIFPLALLVCLVSHSQIISAALPTDEYNEDKIELIEGEDRLIYEYRQNGMLTMIKVVPKKGLPYYMVPLNGAQRIDGLDHQKNLYPQWVIMEW
tara:strand:+ start:1008 stop:1388 length:381 start_codon:yes stop_codon:yes gene_type:complete